MSWEGAVEALLLGFSGAGVCILGYMAHLLIELNSKVAVLIKSVDHQVQVNEDVEHRIRILELGKRAR